jgi:hypothetical protein
VSGIAFVEPESVEHSIAVGQSLNGDYIMNEIYIIARVAQTLLAVSIVAGGALIFQYGYYVI